MRQERGKEQKKPWKNQFVSFNKKISYFEKKLSESIGKPKELWKALKSLVLPNKISSCFENK